VVPFRLMGGTAESLLTKSDCPVLVVKAPGGKTALTSGRAAGGAETADRDYNP